MKLGDFTFADGKYFVAVQYYHLVWNRTVMVLLTDDSLIGFKVNGLISAEGGGDPITMMITARMAIQGDLQDPQSYVKEQYVKKIEQLDLHGEEFLAQNPANFRIGYGDIERVWHNPKKKWGMGHYPQDGRVYVQLRGGRKIEFIIIGGQKGGLIARKINARLSQ